MMKLVLEIGETRKEFQNICVVPVNYHIFRISSPEDKFCKYVDKYLNYRRFNLNIKYLLELKLLQPKYKILQEFPKQFRSCM